MVAVLVIFLTWRPGHSWGSHRGSWPKNGGCWEEGSGWTQWEPEIKNRGSTGQPQAEQMCRAYLPPPTPVPPQAWARATFV